jgi:hypothetical protein
MSRVKTKCQIEKCGVLVGYKDRKGGKPRFRKYCDKHRSLLKGLIDAQ